MSEIVDVQKVIKELDSVNGQIEAILKQLPTEDHHKISELYSLILKQSELLEIQTTKESGTMLLDRAKRVAQFLKREYFNAKYDDRLRKDRDER